MLDPNEIGHRIKLYRQIMHLSQAELAEMTHVSIPYMNYVEKGNKVPSLDLLIDIASVLCSQWLHGHLSGSSSHRVP